MMTNPHTIKEPYFCSYCGYPVEEVELKGMSVVCPECKNIC
jgi:DNA-directed RNA polymerase subunit RPC12/RpoP